MGIFALALPDNIVDAMIEMVLDERVYSKVRLAVLRRLRHAAIETPSHSDKVEAMLQTALRRLVQLHQHSGARRVRQTRTSRGENFFDRCDTAELVDTVVMLQATSCVKAVAKIYKLDGGIINHSFGWFGKGLLDFQVAMGVGNKVRASDVQAASQHVTRRFEGKGGPGAYAKLMKNINSEMGKDGPARLNHVVETAVRGAAMATSDEGVSPRLKKCYACGTEAAKMDQCSACKIAVYCDRRCRKFFRGRAGLVGFHSRRARLSLER